MLVCSAVLKRRSCDCRQLGAELGKYWHKQLDIGSINVKSVVSLFKDTYQFNLSGNTVPQKTGALKLENGFLLQLSAARLDFRNRGYICLAFPQHVIVVRIGKAYKTLHQSEMG